MRKVVPQLGSRVEQKSQKKKVNKKGTAGRKTVIICVAIALILVSVIGGTMAYLTSTTEPVTNTFTYGDINIAIAETATDLDNDGDENTNTYKMFPGNDIEKDPVITVLGKSEDCWLFVKLEKSANFDDFMTFEMADGWQALANTDGVYYMEVSFNEDDQAFGVLKDDKVTVKQEVTKQQLNDLDAQGAYPTLTVTGYAVQRDADISAVDTAVEAWAIAEQTQVTP